MSRTEFLITANELHAGLGSQSAGMHLFDCRFDLGDVEAGRQQWRQGHIPGARYVDLNQDLSDMSQTPEQGRHPLPDPIEFQSRIDVWGIGAQSEVVAYDQGSGALAARLWWLLRAAGHRRVRVLDGGLQAWRRSGGAIESSEPAERSSSGQTFTWALPRDRWLDNRQLRKALSGSRVALLDAREGARYRGEVEPIDPVAGHIPGAISRPFLDNLDADGCLLPAEQLRLAFDQLRGSFAPKQVVHQCGSGVTACHNLLAMEVAGLHGSKLHAPSWSGWLAGAGEVATGPS